MFGEATQNIAECSSQEVLGVVVFIVPELFLFNLEHPVVDQPSNLLQTLAAGHHETDSHGVHHREKQRRKLR